MDSLTDPRRFGSGAADSELARMVAAAIAADEVGRNAFLSVLRTVLVAEMHAGNDEGIRLALGAAPNATHYRVLWDTLAQAVECSPSAAPGLVARAFALPMVIVAASSRSCVIPGTLADVAELQDLFERSGALGPMRNFGFSNALCSLQALEGLSLRAIAQSARDLDPASIRDCLPPAAIQVEPGREQAHLRFIAGAALVSPDAPEFSATAANVGAWGRQCSQVLSRQLEAPGVQLLVLPRPPRRLLSAAQAGRHAQLDVALNLFVSNTVRRFRLRAGDPVAILSTHDDGELRLTLSSPFAPDLVEGFRWPLSRLDDLQRLQNDIVRLLTDVRIGDVRGVPDVLPALRSSGGYWHPRVDEFDTLLAAGLLAKRAC